MHRALIDPTAPAAGNNNRRQPAEAETAQPAAADGIPWYTDMIAGGALPLLQTLARFAEHGGASPALIVACIGLGGGAAVAVAVLLPPPRRETTTDACVIAMDAAVRLGLSARRLVHSTRALDRVLGAPLACIPALATMVMATELPIAPRYPCMVGAATSALVSMPYTLALSLGDAHVDTGAFDEGSSATTLEGVALYAALVMNAAFACAGPALSAWRGATGSAAIWGIAARAAVFMLLATACNARALALLTRLPGPAPLLVLHSALVLLHGSVFVHARGLRSALTRLHAGGDSRESTTKRSLLIAGGLALTLAAVRSTDDLATANMAVATACILTLGARVFALLQ